jgi:hypothetical protein
MDLQKMNIIAAFVRPNDMMRSMSSAGYVPAAPTSIKHMSGSVASSHTLLPLVSIVRMAGKQQKKLTVPVALVSR